MYCVKCMHAVPCDGQIIIILICVWRYGLFIVSYFLGAKTIHNITLATSSTIKYAGQRAVQSKSVGVVESRYIMQE